MVTAAYTIGRFQPPTLGHVRMIEAMLADAQGAPTFVFVSRDASIIPSSMKVEYLRKMLTKNGVFPPALTLVDTATCEVNCGGPLGGFGYLKTRGLMGPGVLMFVGGDREADFNPTTAPMWSTTPVAERPSIRALPRVGTGAATFSSTLARRAVDRRYFGKYLQDGTNALTPSDIARMQRAVSSAVGKASKGGADEDSLLDPALDGGRRRRTRRNKASGRVLYRRGSRSRTGSSKTSRSSYAPRGY